jgi:hypothetical protein
MYARLLFILLFMISVRVSGQISYSYVDPCTGVVKKLQVPTDGITVTYYGQIRNFQANDFYTGSFETWAQSVYSSFGNNNPCSGMLALPAAITSAQSSALSFLGIINSLDAARDFGGSNVLSGTVESTKRSEKKKEASGTSGSGTTTGTTGGTGTSGNGTTGGSGTTTGSGTSGSGTSGSGTTTGTTGGNGTTTGSGTSGSGTSGSGTTTGTTGGTGTSGNGTTTGSGTSGSGTATGTENKTESQGKTDLVGSSVTSVQKVDSKNGNRPNIIASSDFVGFNFKNTDVDYGGKFTGGYTSSRWDGERSHGILVDYTTALRGPNITGFYALIHKKRIDLISTTLSLGTGPKSTVYGTLAIGQMWNLGKNKKLKAVYMLTGSFGNVYEESFVGSAVIAGTMYDLKIGKRVEMKLMGLYVYAPYVSYYNDILLKSPHVVLPIVGTNIKITKKFKININCGGAWAVKESALNYTVMMGTRMLL